MIWIFLGLAVILFAASVLPFLHIAHGLVRTLDFPRIQYALLAMVLLVAMPLLFEQTGIAWVTMALLAASTVIHLTYIVRFTPLWPVKTTSFDGDPDDVATIRLLVSNVKMSNRKYQPLIDLVVEQSPDIAVFMEVDEQWTSALETVTRGYDHVVACPQDNSYGMLLVSRFPFTESRINYLLNDHVPSIDVTVQHPKSGNFRLFAIHPEPPLVNRDTVGRDAEIALVGKKVRDFSAPLIVTGDLNDVAWSPTTQRFKRISRLLDPREGRGMFNTFDARFFFIRWPLDHIFHSSHFQLVRMQRMPFVCSDHFPMLFDLALVGQQSDNGSNSEATREDLEEADDVIAEEETRDEEPAGSDWEK